MNFDADLLSKIVHPLRLSSAFVSYWQTKGKWRVSGPEENNALLHYVTAGEIVIKIKNREPIYLLKGDMILFPHGNAHDVGSQNGGEKAMSLDSCLANRVYQNFNSVVIDGLGNGDMNKFLCAGLCYENNDTLYNLLPDIIILPSEEINNNRLLKNILKGVVKEVESIEDGENFVLYRVMELIYTLSLRVFYGLNNNKNMPQFFINDERIQRALIYMYNNYSTKINMRKLASLVGMSRSSFNSQFQNITGHPPARYLTRIRIWEALKLIDSTNLNRLEIANKVGFDSVVGLFKAIRKYSKD